MRSPPNFFEVIKMFENFSTLLDNQTSFFALAGVFVIILFTLYSRKIKLTTKMLINISLMLAMATVLNYIRIYHFPQGGAVTLGGMIPLLLISFRYGAGVGASAGFIFGLITIIQDPFILHPIQVLFDYPLPSMAAGLAAVFQRNFIASTVLVFVGKFFCHFISGVVFFASYAPEGTSPIIYSLTVNASLIVPECLICCLLIKVLPVQRLLDAMDKKNS